MRDGTLKEGEKLKDVELFSVDPKQGALSLFSFYRQQLKEGNLREDSPMVIIAGSNS